MSITDFDVAVTVWGSLACFTSADSPVERMSYPIMTPSAARGLLEAIYWKPQFQWRIRRIQVVKPIQYVSIMRNELQGIARGERPAPIDADTERTQRMTRALKDVAYIIEADIQPSPEALEEGKNFISFKDQFMRRIRKGGCHKRPCLGLREFAAYFRLTNERDRPDRGINLTLHNLLGDFADEMRGDGKPYRRPEFFKAEVREGVMAVPNELYVRCRR